MHRTALRAVVLCALFVSVVAVGTAGTAAGERTGALDQREASIQGNERSTHNEIRIEQEYRLTPNQPGKIDIRWSFSIPENVVELNTTLPSGAESPRSSGFERRSGGGYVWRESEQSTRKPTLTFTQSVNRTADARGPESEDGRYSFVDAGDWALIPRQPSASIGYRGYDLGEIRVVRTDATEAAGHVGDRLVFLGPHELERRSAHGQTFELLVPEAADLVEERSDLFASVTAASDTLRVGDRDSRVLMIAAPRGVGWGVRGLQTGDRDFYVVADETVDTASNVWVHEYVHTRQDIQRTESTRWFIEASAEYYAGLLTLEQERIGFDAFRAYLGRGSGDRFDDVVLADRSTWHDGADYLKGALVTGTVDRRLRESTDGGATLQSVFGRLNRQSSPVSAADFLRYVREAGGSDVREDAKRFTETKAVPDLWSAATHRAAFGTVPASFEYAFPDVGSDGLRIEGPYRNATATGTDLVVGETLSADVTVTNVGDSEGIYTLEVTQNGRSIAERTGQLAGGDEVVETVETTVTQPGQYRLSTGEDSLTVDVFEPARPTVRELIINRTQLREAGAVRVTATVENAASIPANGSVAIRQAETTIGSERLRLGVGQLVEVSAVTRLTAPGTYQFTAGNRSASVTVEQPSPTAKEEAATENTAAKDSTVTESTTTGSTPSRSTPGATGDGFGVVVALLGLGSLFVLGRCR